MPTRCYLDYAATTPLRPEVSAAMEPYAAEIFGNPSSGHSWGRSARVALDGARQEVAQALGARADEIRFVRGGTESDNLAVLGVSRALRRAGIEPTLLVSEVEHAAVLEAARHAAEVDGATLVTLPVGPDGSMDARSIAAAPARASLLSVMWVNNETGLILPVARLTEQAREASVLVHSDASQAIGKVPVRVDEVPVDLLTATGHKIQGPRGIGILFVREGTPLEPLMFGGGQERAARPGTEDVAGAVGMATAVRLAVAEQDHAAARLGGLRARFEQRALSALSGVRVNSGEGERAGHVSSLAFEDVSDGDALLMALDLEGVAVSGGSACATGVGHKSHVIGALYGSDDRLATVRFSFGTSTSEEEVDHAADVTARVVGRLRTNAEGGL